MADRKKRVRTRQKGGERRSRKLTASRRWLGFVAVVAVTALAASGMRRVPGLLARLPVFGVREVRIEGARYLSEVQVREAAGIGEATNLWDPKDPWLAGLEKHPLVKAVSVRRIPPGTLAFRVQEREPIAFLARDVLQPVDESGIELPIDPARGHLDLPVLLPPGADSAAILAARTVAGEIGRVADFAPDVYAVVSEASWESGDVVLRMGDSLTRLRYVPPLSEVRLREAMAAMNDWVARFDRGPPREIDLRFDDQVVIRAAS